jgi:hypothetical protein
MGGVASADRRGVPGLAIEPDAAYSVMWRADRRRPADARELTRGGMRALPPRFTGTGR